LIQTTRTLQVPGIVITAINRAAGDHQILRMRSEPANDHERRPSNFLFSYLVTFAVGIFLPFCMSAVLPPGHLSNVIDMTNHSRQFGKYHRCPWRAGRWMVDKTSLSLPQRELVL